MKQLGPSKLQLGAGRFEFIDPGIVRIFADESWVHLGDDVPQPRSLLTKLKGKSPSFILRLARDKFRLRRIQNDPAYSGIDPYSLTDFRTFMYEAGDALPFADESFDFIYSEHFFEHLFLDDAVSLLKECRRIMKPGAVIRTCVPDSELKRYGKEGAEFAGFPDTKMSWTHPAKHKTRWTVYSLTTILDLLWFRPVSLFYCDKHGEFIQRAPTREDYPGNPDMESTLSMDYIARKRSLIVDGQKTAI